METVYNSVMNNLRALIESSNKVVRTDGKQITGSLKIIIQHGGDSTEVKLMSLTDTQTYILHNESKIEKP